MSEKWSGALAKPNGCWQKSGLRTRLEQEIGLKCFFLPRQSLLRPCSVAPVAYAARRQRGVPAAAGARHSQPYRPLAMVKGVSAFCTRDVEAGGNAGTPLSAAGHGGQSLASCGPRRSDGGSFLPR